MLVMKSTQLDRMPLHSCATSIVMFGSWKMRACPEKRRAAEVEKEDWLLPPRHISKPSRAHLPSHPASAP